MQNDGQTFKINQLINLLQSDCENTNVGVDQCLKLPNPYNDVSVDSSMMLLPAKSAMAVTPGMQQKAKVSVNVNKNTLNDRKAARHRERGFVVEIT